MLAKKLNITEKQFTIQLNIFSFLVSVGSVEGINIHPSNSLVYFVVWRMHPTPTPFFVERVLARAKASLEYDQSARSLDNVLS